MRSIRSFLCVCVVALLFFNCDLSAQTMAKPAVVIQTSVQPESISAQTARGV